MLNRQKVSKYYENDCSYRAIIDQHQCRFFDETCSSTTVFILLLHGVSINLFFWKPFFFFVEPFCLPTRFLPLLTLKSSVSSSLTSLRVSGCTLNAGYRACHVPHASRITTSGRIFTQVFFSVSSEIIPILVTRFLGNEWWKVSKKYFCSLSKNSEEKEKEKKKKNWRKLHATRNTQSNKNSYNKKWYSFFSLEPLMQPSIVWAALLW